MDICWLGYLGRNHSWSIIAQNISRQLIKMGHKVDLFSTNGLQYFPEDLKDNLRGYIEENAQGNFNTLIGSKLKSNYDLKLSYTSLLNFSKYFNKNDKNKFGIWNYETTILPKGFAKNYKYVDKVLPSSNFSKKIFTDNGIPDDNQVVIPHGISLERIKDKCPLKTSKKYKILGVFGQIHLRKNLPGLLEAYGKAFNKNDDVCLVLKISTGQSNVPSIDFKKILSSWKNKYKNYPEIEVIDQYIGDLDPLYNACDVIITLSFAECFWMVGLEGMAADKIIVSPRYGGQLDYLNDENSILIDGKEIRADLNMQYWESSPYAKVFEPNLDQAATKLKELINNYEDYHKSFSPKMQEMLPNYTWDKITQSIINLCK